MEGKIADYNTTYFVGNTAQIVNTDQVILK